MADHKTDYTAEALERLLSTLQGGTKTEALVSSYLDRCQELEDAAYELLEQRGIDSATGDRLDRIGALVGIPRGGQEDNTYRLRIRAEIAVLNSDGLASDILDVLRLLVGATVAQVSISEYFPKTVYVYTHNLIVDEDTAVIASLLRRAVSAGTELQFIFSTVEVNDANTFHFSETPGTSEAAKTYGFGNGTLNGVA